MAKAHIWTPTFYGMPVPRMELANGTWLDREELAYNTHTGSACGSGRRARAKCFDGKLRIFQVGIPDTFFSIPAVGKIDGKYVRGWVEIQINEVLFHRQSKYRKKPLVFTDAIEVMCPDGRWQACFVDNYRDCAPDVELSDKNEGKTWRRRECEMEENKNGDTSRVPAESTE